jgi:ribosomal protein L44E
MRNESADTLIGQELETYCGKCKTETLHTVTAVKANKISRVMCKTCMGYHLYRAAKETVSSSSGRSARRSKTPRTSTRGKKDWGTLVGQIDDQNVAEYDLGGEFSATPAIRHKTFGVGVITKVLTKNKIEVLFQDGTKILAQNLEAAV